MQARDKKINSTCGSHILYHCTALCTEGVACFTDSVLRTGFGRVSVPRESEGECARFLIECPWRSHQMWLKGIKDSFEGGCGRLHTVLTSIQIPSKSLYITLIKPCAVRFTNSPWSYHKAAKYHNCLVEVELIP